MSSPSAAIASVRYRLLRRLGLAFRRSERREIVPADERARGFRHRRDGERPMVPAGTPGEERGSHRTIREHVRVVAGGRGEARMEIAGDFGRPQHRDIGRQMRIDAAHPRGAGARHVAVEMHDLRRRVHAGVGASRGDRANRDAGDLRQRALERVLHAAPVGLRLPPGVGGSRVFESEGDAHEDLQKDNGRRIDSAARPMICRRSAELGN